MKRWIACALSGAMLLSLASCGTAKTSGESTTLTGKANGFGGVITATVLIVRGSNKNKSGDDDGFDD